MVEQSFWEMLRTKRDSLTKSGGIVADYLVQHAEDAQYLSISSLANACGVAEATIFRFCRSLGFDGYNEMKIALAKATATAMPVALKLEPGVDTQTLVTHAYNTAVEALNGTRSVLDPDAIDRAATLLQRARQVYCLGQGGSQVLAGDIWARFSMTSTKFRTAGDSHMQAITASLMGPEDVLLFVSYSGSTWHGDHPGKADQIPLAGVLPQHRVQPACQKADDIHRHDPRQVFVQQGTVVRPPPGLHGTVCPQQQGKIKAECHNGCIQQHQQRTAQQHLRGILGFIFHLRSSFSLSAPRVCPALLFRQCSPPAMPEGYNYTFVLYSQSPPVSRKFTFLSLSPVFPGLCLPQHRPQLLPKPQRQRRQ